jgi:rRNA-processing protein FCF1
MIKENIVLMDTNTLIYVINNKVRLENIDYLIEGKNLIYITSMVKKELLSLSKKKSKDGIAAKVALLLPLSVIYIKSRTADQSLINAGLKLKEQGRNVYILTNDKKLLLKAKKAGLSTLTIKSLKNIDLG